MTEVTYFADETPGHRRYMEDAHAVYEDDAHQLFAFDVYDGHGGREAAESASRTLTPWFIHEWLKEFDKPVNRRIGPVDILLSAYRSIDDHFVRRNMESGTTAANFYIIGNRFLAANVGDTRIVIGTRDDAYVLTKDHKPGPDEERERIEKLGGRIVSYGVARVEGVLATSRALGDVALKPYVSSEPRILCGNLGRENDFAIIASDGVWDVLTPVEAVRTVRQTADIKRPSKEIIKKALAEGSTDNITVIVVDLRKYVRNLPENYMCILDVIES